MSFQPKRRPLKLGEKDFAFFENLLSSRTDIYAKVKSARILIPYAHRELSSIARKEQTDRPMAERCVDKALSGAIMVALQELGQNRPTAED